MRWVGTGDHGLSRRSVSAKSSYELSLEQSKVTDGQKKMAMEGVCVLFSFMTVIV